MLNPTASQFRLTLPRSSHPDGPRSANYPSLTSQCTHQRVASVCVCVVLGGVVWCSGQRPGTLDSWEICQPSAWAFQTMPHNVLDSPEKQPGGWELPAHHLNSLIWALSSPLRPSPLLTPSVSSSSFSLSLTPRFPSAHFPS